MAERGGQPGNQNGAKGRRWTEAIERALVRRSERLQVDALMSLAEKLLERCDEGELRLDMTLFHVKH